ncbi:TetR/AcrR family transcriptional regulator [Streptomyces sp. NPDC006393]|uniref:TetR/AcrR family transcriptional regulator n=1 Tax=Streptomyces sp. NPDC006393 TaxID=3156763 RepID=UPI00340A866C
MAKATGRAADGAAEDGTAGAAGTAGTAGTSGARAGAGSDAATGRGRRADARRNYAALLEAGREVFTSGGIDAPFDEVARRAGVGRATLYRNFPTREHLFAVLIDDQLADLRTRARAYTEQLTATNTPRPPDEAAAVVADWLRLYYRSGRRYGGMSAQIGKSLDDPDSPVAAACAPMRAAFADLLTAGQRGGAIRPDVTAQEVLALVGALPTTLVRDHATGAPYLDIVLAGLRAP